MIRGMGRGDSLLSLLGLQNGLFIESLSFSRSTKVIPIPSGHFCKVSSNLVFCMSTSSFGKYLPRSGRSGVTSTLKFLAASETPCSMAHQK